MMNYRLVLLFLLTLAVIGSSPALAASTGYKDIAWIKVTPDGVMIALDGFTLADYDATTCADPGQAYFYLPSTAKNYEERYAAILTAVTAERQINVAYWSCGENPGANPMLALGNLNYR